MPLKHSQYEVDEYVQPTTNNLTPTANNPTGSLQPITQRHTQYKMSKSCTSWIKTVLNVEHEAEPTMATNAMVAEDTDIPNLIQVDYDLDDEEPNNPEGNSGYDNNINHELEAAGLGEVHVIPGAIPSRCVRKIHTISRILSLPLVFFLSHVGQPFSSMDTLHWPVCWQTPASQGPYCANEMHSGWV